MLNFQHYLDKCKSYNQKALAIADPKLNLSYYGLSGNWRSLTNLSVCSVIYRWKWLVSFK